MLGLEDVAPGDQAEEHRPQRVHVGAGVDGLAAGLLRRHEVRRADDLPALGGEVVGLGRLDHAEVDELDRRAAPVDEEDVGELEVAVDDAARVHRRHGRRRAAHHLDRVPHAERRPPLALAEVFPLEPLHGEEEPPVVPGAVPDVLHDVGVTQVGEDGDLAGEAGALLGRGRLAQQLDRDLLPRLPVDPPEDVPHPPAAHAGLDRKSIARLAELGEHQRRG